MKKPFKETVVGKLATGLFRETLQTLPIIGSVVTAFKTDSIENPKGQIKLQAWDFYRMALGVGIAFVLYKGILTIDQIKEIVKLIGF